MKTVKSKDIVTVNGVSSIVCPYCKKSHELNMLRFNTPRDFSTALASTNSSFDSVDKNIINFTTGNFAICPHCHELFFVYEESDTRICRQCAHCSVSNPAGSLVYKCEIRNQFVGYDANGYSYTVDCKNFVER